MAIITTNDKANARNKEIRKEQTQDVANVHHLIVLDESGSMSCIRQQTISGCNETIQTIRIMQEKSGDTQRHFVSIYLFDSGNSRYIVQDQPIGEVRELTPSDYNPNACTPLYDAMGFTLNRLKKTIAKEKALAYVTVITDGYENDSREYSLPAVAALIEEMKKKGVIFSFIGANVDSTEYAKSLHIDNAMQFDQTDEGTAQMWATERRSRMRSWAKYKVSRACMDVSEEAFACIGNSGGYYADNRDASRVTPKDVKRLKAGQILVFGTDGKGAHKDGMAAYAVEHFGAERGRWEGPMGRSYAIPTQGVTEKETYDAVTRFVQYAKLHADLTFLVTDLGTGGQDACDMAPMLEEAVRLPNVMLPEAYWDFL